MTLVASRVALLPEHSARSGPAAAAVESSLHRLVLVVLPPWLAVLTLEGLVAGPVWAGPVVAAASAVALAGYVAFVGAGPRRRPMQLLFPLVLSAGILVVLNQAALEPDSYPLLVNWLAMTCFCIGALLRGRAVVWACGVAVGGWLAVALAHELWAGSTITAGLYLVVAVFSLVDGLVVAAAAAVARNTASGVDEAEADRSLMAATAARSEAADRELQRLTRVMHDTAVNTLGAVHRWPQQDRSALARRCAADLAILARTQHREIRQPQDLVASVVSRAELLGVDLRVDAERWGPDLDPAVAAALEGAGWEALNNVVKHSGQHQARLQWSWDGGDGALVLSDPGRGVPPEGGGTAGGGLESVTRRAAEAGVSMRVDPAPGGGTRVALRWSVLGDLPREPHGSGGSGVAVRRQPGTLESVLAEAAWRIAAILTGVGAISTISQDPGPPRWGSLAALVIVAVVAGYSRAIARGAVGPVVPAGMYAVATLLASLLPGIGATGCARTGDWWWGPMAGLAVICAAVLVDRRNAVVLSTVVAYAVGTLMVIGAIGDPGGTCAQDSWAILVFNLAIVLALVLFRRQLEGLWEQGQAIHDALRHDAVTRARADEATRVRQEHVAVAQRVAGPILESLSTGQADPLDPQTRDEAGRAEGALRALAAISGALPPDQAEALAELVLGAYERGVALHLSLPSHLTPGTPLDPDPSSPVLRAFVDACPAASTAQLTYLHMGTSAQVMALAAIAGFDLTALHRALALDPVTWTLDNRDGQVLLEGARALRPIGDEELCTAGPGAVSPRPAQRSRRESARFTNSVGMPEAGS